MGEVYRARDTRLGRDVAVKVLPGEVSHTPERLHRFEQEARLAGSLNHPNVLALFDVGSHDGAPYLVTELLEGRTLREILAAGPLPPRKAVEYAQQIARGLAAAHERGVVHRDLKPANLFVTKDGRVKILDFGLAKLTQVDPQRRRLAALDRHRRGEGRGDDRLHGAGAGAGPGGGRAVGHLRPRGGRLRDAVGPPGLPGDTAADTMTAILTKDPEELSREGLTSRRAWSAS